MNGQLDQIDEMVDQRIREGFSGLRDEVAASADVEAALAAARSEPRRGVWSRPSVRITAVAAAAVMAVVVGYATWPREVEVTTGGTPSGSVRPGPTTPATTIAPVTTATVTSPPPSTVPPMPPTNPEAHLIVGGQPLPGRPSRDPGYNDIPGSRSPDGSGCSVDGDVLPDGAWYGYLAVHNHGLALDLACRFTNDAARWAIRTYEDRRPDDSDERFVLNESTRLRPLPLDDRSSITDIAAFTYDLSSWQEVTAQQLSRRVEELGAEQYAYRMQLAAWVKVTDGRVEWLDVSGDNYAG